MKPVFQGKKIEMVSTFSELAGTVHAIVTEGNGMFFLSRTPQEAIFHTMSRNPDLVIVDSRMPSLDGQSVVSLLKRVRQKIRILLITESSAPQRSIDVTAQGISYTISLDASPEVIYQALKHSLSIPSVPRGEHHATG